MEHKRREPQYFNHSIPEHLIFEHILPKLPVKTLVRFKSVSKTWQSTITAQNFVKSHLDYSSSSPKFILFGSEIIESIEGDDLQCFGYSLSYEEQDRQVSSELVRLDFTYSNLGSFIGVGSCNGLVCLYTEYTSSICIWNPATRQYAKIKLTRPESRVIKRDTIFEVGFCYVSSSDEYKIVAFVRNHAGRPLHIKLHYLKTGISKIVHVFSAAEEIELQGIGGSVVVDDIMYWPPIIFESYIIGFDVVSEKLVKKPQMQWMKVFSKFALFQIKGCLSMCCRKDTSDLTCQVWTLKRHDNWNSWKKLFDIDLRGICLESFSDCGLCLVRDLDSGQFKLFDPSKEKLERSEGKFESDDDHWQEFEALGYVESLVWPTVLRNRCYSR